MGLNPSASSISFGCDITGGQYNFRSENVLIRQCKHAAIITLIPRRLAFDQQYTPTDRNHQMWFMLDAHHHAFAQ